MTNGRVYTMKFTKGKLESTILNSLILDYILPDSPCRCQRKLVENEIKMLFGKAQIPIFKHEAKVYYKRKTWYNTS